MRRWRGELRWRFMNVCSIWSRDDNFILILGTTILSNLNFIYIMFKKNEKIFFSYIHRKKIFPSVDQERIRGRVFLERIKNCFYFYNRNRLQMKINIPTITRMEVPSLIFIVVIPSLEEDLARLTWGRWNAIVTGEKRRAMRFDKGPYVSLVKKQTSFSAFCFSKLACGAPQFQAFRWIPLSSTCIIPTNLL